MHSPSGCPWDSPRIGPFFCVLLYPADSATPADVGQKLGVMPMPVSVMVIWAGASSPSQRLTLNLAMVTVEFIFIQPSIPVFIPTGVEALVVQVSTVVWLLKRSSACAFLPWSRNTSISLELMVWLVCSRLGLYHGAVRPCGKEGTTDREFPEASFPLVRKKHPCSIDQGCLLSGCISH